jgi:hypothetical protein
MKKYVSNYDDSRVEDDIKLISHTFQEWRYFYEKDNNINLQFLEVFFNSLKNKTISPPLRLKSYILGYRGEGL